MKVITQFCCLALAGVLLAVSSAGVVHADDVGAAEQLLAEVRQAALSLPLIAESDETLTEWAGQQGVFCAFAELEAQFGHYDNARKFIARLDREDSRNDTLSEVAIIAAGRGDIRVAAAMVRERVIPAEEFPNHEEHEGHEDALVSVAALLVLRNLRGFPPSPARTQALSRPT